MKDSKKAKWILGVSGVTLSAFLLTQVASEEKKNEATQQVSVIDETMSKDEKALAKLDWTNFEVHQVQQAEKVRVKSDRVTRRS